MGLFDAITSILGGNSAEAKTTEKKKKKKNDIVNIDSSLIENYADYLKKNDIYLSFEIEDRLKNLSKRAGEPMKLAVSGLFSSGKSTFLNAMLSDDILPSGNLPITSKITYLRYGKDPQLKLTYFDGREELASVDNIARYVSQQSADQIKNINHITLYYPKEILKSIVFVDTPGFNSPNKMDDETTEDILENVDGIIWLTMISNAGQKSEIDILEKYFKQYNQKSICIVNHKDEIDDEDEVAEFIEELKEDNNFSKYFADIIPISAIQALESRQKDQNQLMLKLVRDFSGSMEEKLISHIGNETIFEAYESVMKDDLVEFMRKHSQIMKSDKQENKTLLEESNIGEVFQYVEKEIMPYANSTLSFSLQKELKDINNEIGDHYNYLVDAIDALEVILKEFSNYQKQAMKVIVLEADKYVSKINRDIDSLVDIVANILKNSFKAVKKEEFESDGEISLLGFGKPTGDFTEYTVYIANEEYIKNDLLKENGSFIKASDSLGNSLDKLLDTMGTEVFNIQESLSNKISSWKDKYKNLEEFSPENIDLQEIALESFDIFSNDFENQAIYFYKDLFLEVRQIHNTMCDIDVINNAGISAAYPFNESMTRPTYDNMKKNLEITLNTNWIANKLNGKDSFIVVQVDAVKKVLKNISNEKLEAILPIKKEWKIKNELLKEYMKQLEKSM